MKAKILGFFFSLLIVAGAKGQTIDGVLYTNFNNYYKWRGGGFDSTLLIPTIPASIGRRPGAIYYKSADSSLYSWTGWQWRKVGVELDTTSLSNRIDERVVIGSDASLKSLTITGTNGNGHIHLRHQASLPTATGQSTVIYANNSGDFAYKNDGNYHTTFATSANTADRTYTFQNKSYTVADNADVVKYTDTSAMLNPYLRKVDTASLSNRINLKLNISDTSAMLTPYLRSINAGVRWQGVDSSLASNWAVNGFHEVDETMMRASAANNPGQFIGSKYWGAGNWAGVVEDDVNYIQGSTTTGATNVASSIYASSASILQLYVPSSNWFIYTTRVRIPTLNDGTQKFYVNMGVLNAVPSAALSEGVGFLYDLDGTTTGSSASANWQTYSTNNSTRTFNQNHTGVAVAANTWTKLKVIFNNSVAYYYVNDVLIATHTSNIPAGDNIAPAYAIIKTAGIVARTFQVDYSTIDIKYSIPR